MKAKHTTDGIVCCQQKFNTYNALLLHKRIFHSDRTKCNICNVSLNSRIDLKFHLDVHVYGPVQCEACVMSFSKREAYLRHLLQHGKLLKHNVVLPTPAFSSDSSGVITFKEESNNSQLYLGLYGINGMITDHVVGFTQLFNVQDAGEARQKQAIICAPEKAKRFLGCGSIRDLKKQGKRLISCVPLNIYCAENEFYRDVPYLSKSVVRIITVAKTHSKVDESLLFFENHIMPIVKKVEAAIAAVPKYYRDVIKNKMKIMLKTVPKKIVQLKRLQNQETKNA